MRSPRQSSLKPVISGAQFVVEHRGDRWLVAGFSRVYSPSELLEQGRTRDQIVDELVAAQSMDRAEAEEIFDRSLDEEAA
jgi:hypothetical protein